MPLCKPWSQQAFACTLVGMFDMPLYTAVVTLSTSHTQYGYHIRYSKCTHRHYTILMTSQVLRKPTSCDVQYDQIVPTSVLSYAARPYTWTLLATMVITSTNGQTTGKPRIGGITDSWAELSSGICQCHLSFVRVCIKFRTNSFLLFVNEKYCD
jgi:hypothetical protein